MYTTGEDVIEWHDIDIVRSQHIIIVVHDFILSFSAL